MALSHFGFINVLKKCCVIYIIMNKIKVNECVYRIHPVYNLYAANENGELIHIIKKNTNTRYKKIIPDI